MEYLGSITLYNIVNIGILLFFLQNPVFFVFVVCCLYLFFGMLLVFFATVFHFLSDTFSALRPYDFKNLTV